MRIIKAIVPMIAIIGVKLTMDMSVISHHDGLRLLLRNLIFWSLPFLIVLIAGLIYFWKHKWLKLSMLGLLGLVLLHAIFEFGPLLLDTVFNLSINFFIINKQITLLFFLILSGIALFAGIRSRNTVSIVFAGISIALVIYVELVYLPNLDFTPYKELKTLLSNGFFDSITRSAIAVFLGSLPVFTTMYSLLNSVD